MTDDSRAAQRLLLENCAEPLPYIPFALQQPACQRWLTCLHAAGAQCWHFDEVFQVEGRASTESLAAFRQEACPAWPVQV